jgi:serine acetyltransferase
VLEDWAVNPRNPKIQLSLLAFRIAQRAHRAPRWWRPLTIPLLILYRVGVEWLLGIELHPSLEVGPRLRVFHGNALVVNPETRIGADCILRHSTTLGLSSRADDPPSAAPRLGDRVEVGPHCLILGGVQIGDDAVIGGGSVVVHDVAAGAVVAGNPARRLGGDDSAEDSTG